MFDLDEHINSLVERCTAHAKKKKNTWFDADYCRSSLLLLREGLLTGNYWTAVRSVSASGMSRIIVVSVLANNEFFTITQPEILDLASIDKNGRISGCGMDMLFAAQHSFFHFLCPDKDYTKEMPRYRDLP